MTFDTKPDGKEAAILTAAFEAFARYGLRRTSMQDIAKGAGMSRAALYLRFAGKEDIFRALARHHFTAAKADIEQALARKASVAETLLAVFVALDGQVSEVMMTSPHAEELIDNKSAFIDAQVLEIEAEITRAIGDWIARGIAAGKISLDGIAGTPAEVAKTIIAAKYGLKETSKTFAEYRSGQKRVAALFGKALTKP
jgi:AcrR family transcriptional regulator